jgi:hypothetical protein
MSIIEPKKVGEPPAKIKFKKFLKSSPKKFLCFLMVFRSDLHCMTINLAKEASAHALGFQTIEAGCLYKNGASYGVM